MQKLLENPQFMKIALTAAIGTFFFFLILLLGYMLYRKLKNEVHGESLAQSPIRIAENNSAFSLAAYEGVIRKLKDQEKELERLRRSERERAFESASMSEAVLSNLGSGVLLFSPAGLVRQANPAARSLLGYASPTGLHTRDVFRGVSEVRLPVLPPGDDSLSALADQAGSLALVTAVEQSMKLGFSFRRLEADYVAPDGKQRVLGITISPVKGVTGDVLGAAVLVSDLTEITHLSRQVRLRENMASLGEMSAGIAHEFKNSLATISGYSQMLSADDATRAADAQFAGKITAETASLSRIVNDFLNFARPQGFAQEPVDLVAVLRDCAEECRVQLDFGAAEPGTRVVAADPTALRQALSNLLRNSAEAVTEGQQAIVRVAMDETPDTLRLTLADNGCGIPEEALPRVFVPFFTTKASGTGLGLALVHRIITEQGGSIQVESVPGSTTFTLTLPRPKNPPISG